MYSILISSVLLYTAETWSLFVTDPWKMHIRNFLWWIVGICWYGHITNTGNEILQCTGETLSHYLSSWRTAFFGHVARLSKSTLGLHGSTMYVDKSLNRLPDRSWRRCPGRPRIKWSDQFQDTTLYNTLEISRSVEEWCNGPCWLHHSDDDELLAYKWITSAC